MDFGAALGRLKLGERVARTGWNGKSMWLTLVMPERLPTLQPMLQAELLNSLTEHQLKPLPYIAMRTADSGFVPWLASQTDLLAEDWVGVAS